MELTPDTPDAQLARLSIPSRGSQRRRRTLERLANICTAPDVSVAVRFSTDEAYCHVPDATDGDDEAGDGEPIDVAGTAGGGLSSGDRAVDYEVVIPTQGYDQVRTEMAPERWDKRVQVALLFHELGHVKYSDFGRLSERLEATDPEWREVLRRLYNAAEDGVVETQMAAEFNVREDFVVLNSTLAALETEQHDAYNELFAEARDGAGVDGDTGVGGDSPLDGNTSVGGATAPGDGAPDPAGVLRGDPDRRPLTYTVLEALCVGLLDRGFGDSTRFAEIVDPDAERRVVRDGRADVVRTLEPRLDDLMADLLAEPDGARRVDRCVEFFESIREHLDPLPRVQLTGVEVPRVRPEDTDAPAITNPAPAHLLPGDDVTTAHVTGGDSHNTGTCDVSGSDETPSRPAGTLTEETVSRAVATFDDSTVLPSESRDRSPLEREATRFRSYISRSDTDLERAGVAEPAPGVADDARWQQATQAARQLRADLQAQLRRRRRTKLAGGHRSGSLDAHRVVRVKQGSDRVFARREAGDDRDYSCVVVLDRSGSMAGNRITAAEDAAAQLAYALSSVGVDVSVLSVWRSTPWLEVPFGSDPGEHVDRLLTGRASGATPLSPLLGFARDRVRGGDGAVPMVFVVTDGRPDDESAYKTELDRCTFPVFGVYLADGSRSHSQFFDRMVASSPTDVDRTLRSLVRNMLR